ncbi:hypothetical protein AgCh_021178 [Apium graveolens]
MDVNEADKKQLFQQDYQAFLDSVSFDAESFTHHVPAYQILADQGNEAAERTLNLVHTIASMQKAKDAINAFHTTIGVDFDSLSCEFRHSGRDDEEEEPMDLGGEAGSNRPIQLFKPPQMPKPKTKEVDVVKASIADIKRNVSERLESKLPEATMRDLHQRLRKEYETNSKIDVVSRMVINLESELTKIRLNQAHQTMLLQQLVAAHTKPKTSQLDANKKGEKGSITSVSQGAASEGEAVLKINVSKVIISEITFTKPPVMDSIDLINLKVAELMKSGRNLTHHFSQVKQISVNEMSLGDMEKGQPSCIKSPKANLVWKPKRNYPKSSDKNPLDLMNGKEICVVAGHPQFVEAKKEEKERIKQEKKQAALDAKKLKQKKKQAAIVAKLHAVKTATEISEKQPVIAEAQDQKMHKEP